mgnify:CR=1 FL=1|jgi:hypothetical protein
MRYVRRNLIIMIIPQIKHFIQIIYLFRVYNIKIYRDRDRKILDK